MAKKKELEKKEKKNVKTKTTTKTKVKTTTKKNYEEEKVKEFEDLEKNINTPKKPYLDYSIRLIIRIIAILVFLILAIVLLYLGTTTKKKTSLAYQEASNVDYKVHLKENSYYDEEFLSKDMQYIANLIDYVDINFNYAFKANDNIDSEFSYYIVGDVFVYDQDNGNKVIYRKTYPLTDKKTIKVTDKNTAFIEESLKVDYDFYNDTIKTFKSDYNLLATSNIQLTLYIDSIGESVSKIPLKTNSNMSMTIPLTEQTVNIAMDYEEINKEQVVTGSTAVKISNYTFTIAATISFLIALILIAITSIFYKKTTKKKTKYELYLSKILREYDRLIAETKDINIEEDATVIEVKSFEELLDIRDNLQLPILYLEIHKGQKAWFVIKNKKDYYRFILKAVDMESEKR